MSDDVKHSLIWAAAITVMFVTLVVSHNLYFQAIQLSAMQNGYSQKLISGERGVYWVKD